MINPNIEAQESMLPYREIPEYPSDFGPGNLISRMIDGLGYRFYWATEGLTDDDLTYRASENGRSIFETVEHINVMSNNILLAPDAKPFEKPKNTPQLSFEELRTLTLKNLDCGSKTLGAASTSWVAPYTKNI